MDLGAVEDARVGDWYRTVALFLPYHVQEG